MVLAASACGGSEPSVTLQATPGTLDVPAFAVQPLPVVLGLTSVPSGVAWTASGSAWLGIAPSSGTTPSSVTVTPTAAGMKAGLQSGTVTISASGQVLNVAVHMTVPSTSGTWSGPVPHGRTLTVTMAEGASITGSGSLDTTGTSVSCALAGSHAHPAVTLGCTAPLGTGSVIVTAAFVTSTTLTGTITGTMPGATFNGETITLTHQ